jgi:hypothetical protein
MQYSLDRSIALGYNVSMNAAQITRASALAQIPFKTALQIREILEAARTEYGPKQYDEGDGETQILELVTGDEE